ncbi:MAG: hypothetical protein FJ107_06675 [Deltaproteobacteria bacterium]|nr:hypothetical protein [Deltaproteobacteria bacterium]MBM4347803.1 hypothetical protein [Deltaproteobacteria bacterium]
MSKKDPIEKIYGFSGLSGLSGLFGLFSYLFPFTFYISHSLVFSFPHCLLPITHSLCTPVYCLLPLAYCLLFIALLLF